MVSQPFNNNSGAPYGYRIFTPIVAHYVEKSGLYYRPAHSPFKDNLYEYYNNFYDAGILEALIFTNFIFTILAMFFIHKTYDYWLTSENKFHDLYLILLPLGLLLSTSTIVHGLNGLTEGGSFFFVSLCCYLVARGKFYIFTLTIFLGMFQRELIPLIMFLYCLLNRKYRFGFVSLLAFLAYFAFRKLHPLVGFEEQLSLAKFLVNLNDFNITREFIFQVILSNNILIAILPIALVFKDQGFNSKSLVPFFIIFFVLLVISIGTGIGNNAGRILNMATPILLLTIPFFVMIKNTKINQLK
jgi:hypothetical protein